MKKTALILMGIAALALVICAGFLLGRDAYNKNTSAETALVEKDSTSSEPLRENSNIYDVSPPSRGAYIKTIPVNLAVDADTATADVSDPQIQSISPGQKAILYRADGMLLEILGEVTSVEKSGHISIKIGADADHPTTDAVRGEIIIQKESDAQRLPLSALVKDGKGQEYLWEVIKDPEQKQKVVMKPASIIGRTYDYVVINQTDSISNVFILNPDSDLQDGQTVTTRALLYSAPPETPDMKVMQSINARTPLVPGDPYRGPIINTPCEDPSGGNDANSAAGDSGQGCGASENVLDDFIQKVRESNQARTTTTSP